MAEEIKKTLCGHFEETDIYKFSYNFSSSDFEDLTEYIRNEYEPENMYSIIKKERLRLQRIQRINRSAEFLDNSLSTNISDRLKSAEFRYAENRILRFALMRDLGEDASLVNLNGFSGNWGELLKLKDPPDPEKFYEDAEYFTSIAMEICKCDDKASFLWLHGYLCEFIRMCPKSYLEKGIFGKLMRAVFGAMFFGHIKNNTEYDKICRLAAYFGITYLFDDILDDPDYSEQEKFEYYSNVLSILKSENEEEIHYSPDPLMAFSEAAFTGIVDLLDEKRAKMVARSYMAIAKATRQGSEWHFDTPLSGNELYSVATVKAAYTRIIPGILSGSDIDEKFLTHCMRGGLIYQLTDDLRDIPEDLSENNITPFNYFSQGAVKLENHPIEILIAAISRISDDYLSSIPDAKELWIMRLTHSLRVLKLKSDSRNISDVFREMDFPDNKITRELAMIADCFDVIVDIEAEAAEYYSGLSVGIRGGWSKGPAYGH